MKIQIERIAIADRIAPRPGWVVSGRITIRFLSAVVPDNWYHLVIEQ